MGSMQIDVNKVINAENRVHQDYLHGAAEEDAVNEYDLDGNGKGRWMVSLLPAPSHLHSMDEQPRHQVTSKGNVQADLEDGSARGGRTIQQQQRWSRGTREYRRGARPLHFTSLAWLVLGLVINAGVSPRPSSMTALLLLD